MDKDLLNLLNEVHENGDDTPEGDRILMVDGLNLFFRNFTVNGNINKQGAHIGGLGGFLRSLGSLMYQVQPTHVYMIFDGMGSTVNRKNIIPEYKAGRNIKRVTNWDMFDSQEDEDDSKIDQLQRVIQYLKALPVKTMAMSKVEADDVIAYLSDKLSQDKTSKVFMVTNDEDYLQLVKENVALFYPFRKKFYTPHDIEQEYGLPAENFIFYKVLLGDKSDNLPGIKGLGKGKLFKLFPEVKTKGVSLDDIISISETKLKEHVIYARLLNDLEGLKKRFKVMDLGDPMLSDLDKAELDEFMAEETPKFTPLMFEHMHEQDKLNPFIRDVGPWLREHFSHLK